MNFTPRSIKNYVFILLIFSLFDLKAAENTEALGLKQLDALVLELKQTLASGTLVEAERDQIYDIVGSLSLCRPVAQTVLEQSQGHMPSPSSEPVPPHPSEHAPDHISDQTADLASARPHDMPVVQHVFDMNTFLRKFDAIKQHLIQQLSENKVEPDHHESAYTLIGSINLCRPILKGADLLSKKLKAETTKSAPSSPSISDSPRPILDHSTSSPESSTLS